MGSIEIISLVFIVIAVSGLIVSIYSFIIGMHGINKPKKIDKEPTFCILIPARDESKVIESPLKSIKNQSVNVNMNDVYVIVEDPKDKTCDITKNYGANIIIRKKLDLKRKGYALDEAVKEIKNKNKHYDMYFIVDADNVLEKDFLKHMIKTYKKGFDIAVSHRDSKNANENVVAGASALTFAIMDIVINTGKTKNNSNIGITGTGFYIKGKFIEDIWKGFPFHELTEDFEITLYTQGHDITSTYCKEAIFFDEQPTKIKQSITQRTRWVRGFLDARHNRVKEIRERYNTDKKKYRYLQADLLGITQYLAIVIGIIGLFITNLVGGIILLINNNPNFSKYLFISLGILIGLYLVLLIFTLILLIGEGNSITMSTKMKIKQVFYHPIFLTTYVICYFKALFNKNIGWEKIEHHTKDITN